MIEGWVKRQTEQDARIKAVSSHLPRKIGLAERDGRFDIEEGKSPGLSIKNRQSSFINPFAGAGPEAAV
jgi:hypothetical protein